MTEVLGREVNLEILKVRLHTSSKLQDKDNTWGNLSGKRIISFAKRNYALQEYNNHKICK